MISSIVLAAGMSSRMGEPKALLPWAGEPLIVYQVRQLQQAGVDEIIVVLGHRADEIQREMRTIPCRVMFNALHHTGRAGSLRIGAKAVTREADAIVIVNVDQPRPASLVRTLIDAHHGAATIPTFEGRRGHPVVVAGSLRDELMHATDETEGLRGILEAHASEITEVPCEAIVELDLNTPDDYAAARDRFGLALR